MANYASFYLEANDDLRIGRRGDAAWTSFSFRVWERDRAGNRTTPKDV